MIRSASPQDRSSRVRMRRNSPDRKSCNVRFGGLRCMFDGSEHNKFCSVDGQTRRMCPQGPQDFSFKGEPTPSCIFKISQQSPPPRKGAAAGTENLVALCLPWCGKFGPETDQKFLCSSRPGGLSENR